MGPRISVIHDVFVEMIVFDDIIITYMYAAFDTSRAMCRIQIVV